MTGTIHVSTRKGLFTLGRSSTGQWETVNVSFLGSPLSMSLADPRDGNWYAAADLGHFGAHLHRSSDRGVTWTEVAAPVFPEGATLPERMASESETPKMKPAAALRNLGFGSCQHGGRNLMVWHDSGGIVSQRRRR